MSDLQTAIDRLDQEDALFEDWTEGSFDDFLIVVEAARLVADPSWWIEQEHGERVAGPFTTEDDANRARVWVEAVRKPETFWIRQHAAALTPQGEPE